MWPAVTDRGYAAGLLWLPGGLAATVRVAGPSDAETLQQYFRTLSPRSRTNRLMGPALELPPPLIERFVNPGEACAYTLLVTLVGDAGEQVIAEARYAFDTETVSVEFGLSVADRWQTRGLGRALIEEVTCRAAALGAVRLFGDTLRDNAAMIALARSAGFVFAPTPGDWKQVRFEAGLLASTMKMTRCGEPAAAAE